MINFFTGILGIVGVCVFMGIMLWWVPALPLIIICLFVLVLLVIDFVGTVRVGNNAADSQ